MRWQDLRRSSNVEDRRGARGARGLAGGGAGILLVMVVGYVLGVDPRALLQLADTGLGSTASGGAPVDDEPSRFVGAVLGSTEETWAARFQETGRAYAAPTLVLFRGSTPTACGYGQAAMGPFYCPGDRQVYIDLSFYEDLRSRFAAPGDFAQAYVIAHEVGHHVQHLLGISDRVHAMRGSQSAADANAMSVRLELQADCFAGLWAHDADAQRQILEAGDVDEALTAAAAIGDDRLQRQAGGTVSPESFTHGTSEQRSRWFRRGLEGGNLASCDTFQAARL